MGKLTLILGGARSGKSTHAQRLAAKHGGRVAFIATAAAGDDEMKARIARHRSERPADWITREIPLDLAQALQIEPITAEVVLLDCLTLLVSNLLVREETEIDEASAATQVHAEVDGLLSAMGASGADWIVVSNEVGLGIVPPYPLGRLYRDLLGRANQRFAARADEVFWMVAGIPVPIHQYRGNI